MKPTVQKACELLEWMKRPTATGVESIDLRLLREICTELTRLEEARVGAESMVVDHAENGSSPFRFEAAKWLEKYGEKK